jgi:hypothetical protein
MFISLAHCITQKNHFFTSTQPLGSHSPMLVHRHVHSTDLLSYCITEESHLEFLVNSSAQRRLIHHLHFCSHENFTRSPCAQPQARPTLQISFLTALHRGIIGSSSQLLVRRRPSLRLVIRGFLSGLLELFGTCFGALLLLMIYGRFLASSLFIKGWKNW